MVFGVLGLVIISPALLLFAADNIAAAIAVGVVGLLLLIAYLVFSGAVETFDHLLDACLPKAAHSSQDIAPRPNQSMQ